MMAITGPSHSTSQIADTRNARPTVGRTCSGISSPSALSCTACALPPPWPSPTIKAADPARAPTKPITPAASTMSGNGTWLKKIATKANAASAIIAPLFNARLPTR